MWIGDLCVSQKQFGNLEYHGFSKQPEKKYIPQSASVFKRQIQNFWGDVRIANMNLNT